MSTKQPQPSILLVLIFLIVINLSSITCKSSKGQLKHCKNQNHSASVNAKCFKSTEPAPQPPQNKQILAFADQRLAVVYPVIQNFKSIITSDPLGITKTWTGPDICNYRGFYCDNPPDNASAITVASIDFNGFQLAAPSLNGFLDQFPDIALFHANTNSFRGTLPSNISSLRYLYELDLSNNLLTGQFPSAVVGMNGLTFLDLRFNSFTGSVPSQIYTQNLDFLFLNDNDFITTLPDNLGITHILLLTLANNKIVGPIPRGIFKAFSFLKEVLLLNNELTGCLPYEIGLLQEAIAFDVSNNQLTGPLPWSLACLDKVEQLNFAGNLLYGMVPEVACELDNLVNLSLSDNYFTQVGPLCRSLIIKGVLDVSNNCIPGLPFQRSVIECAKFFAVPMFCPRPWCYTYIPCKSSSSSASKSTQIAPSP